MHWNNIILILSYTVIHSTAAVVSKELNYCSSGLLLVGMIKRRRKTEAKIDTIDNDIKMSIIPMNSRHFGICFHFGVCDNGKCAFVTNAFN